MNGHYLGGRCRRDFQGEERKEEERTVHGGDGKRHGEETGGRGEREVMTGERVQININGLI